MNQTIDNTDRGDKDRVGTDTIRNGQKDLCSRHNHIGSVRVEFESFHSLFRIEGTQQIVPTSQLETARRALSLFPAKLYSLLIFPPDPII